ncbi:MAG: BLUF domain-containing protein [Bryobacteraceae bacterium]|nr:BLUF domain-containing protein [Bryobacteraceae bacterium]
MEPDLYSIVYCSRNLIGGDPAEVTGELKNILASSRVNNGRVGITGALLYNSGSFAQVLEGPLQAVEQTFERIQCDSRHSEVTVIQSGPVSARQFPEWSMALTSNSSFTGTPVATAAFDAVFSHAADAGEKMLSIMHDMIVSDEEWALLDTAP